MRRRLLGTDGPFLFRGGLWGRVRLSQWLIYGCTYFPYGCAAPHLHVSCIVSHSRSGLILRPDVGGREEVDRCRIERVALVKNLILIDVSLIIRDTVMWLSVSVIYEVEISAPSSNRYQWRQTEDV